MKNPPDPKPTTLGGIGPFLLPPVETFAGLEIEKGGRLPPRLRFILRDGSELFLPAEQTVLRRLHAILGEYLGPMAVADERA
jgi:hypothetical protein